MSKTEKARIPEVSQEPSGPKVVTLDAITERANAFRESFPSPEAYKEYMRSCRRPYDDPARTPSKRALLAYVKAEREKALGRPLADDDDELYG